MSVAKRGDGRFVVKFKDEKGAGNSALSVLMKRLGSSMRIANMIRWKTRA